MTLSLQLGTGSTKLSVQSCTVLILLPVKPQALLADISIMVSQHIDVCGIVLSCWQNLGSHDTDCSATKAARLYQRSHLADWHVDVACSHHMPSIGSSTATQTLESGSTIRKWFNCDSYRSLAGHSWLSSYMLNLYHSPNTRWSTHASVDQSANKHTCR